MNPMRYTRMRHDYRTLPVAGSTFIFLVGHTWYLVMIFIKRLRCARIQPMIGHLNSRQTEQDIQ